MLHKCGWRPWCENREVYFPEGEWTHLWTGAVSEGPARVEVAAPLQEPPVFYRKDDPEAVSAVEDLRDYDVGVHEP